ncbi:MAG: hypothetical protein V7L20_08910 [Nostoc sp.]|uniref:hypothetical protein n=1 Tax=Nostoc sp. TaxID=1180 RepID=UPI002FF56FC1
MIHSQAIALYENLVEQQEKAHNETLEQREAQKMWIYQKRQELEQVQNGLEVILSKCTSDAFSTRRYANGGLRQRKN